MKIAVIFPKDSEAIFDGTSSKTFGGASIQMLAISTELSKQEGNNVFCLVPKISNSLNNTNLRLVEVFNVKKNILGTIYLFHKKIKQEYPDVIIQHGLTLFSCLLSLYCKFFKIKFIFMFASDLEVKGKYQSSSKKCFLFKFLLRNTNLLITQNKYQQKYLLSSYNLGSHLMYMGFPIREIKDVDRNSILWIGRCDPVKQPEIFIDLARKNLDLNFVMICPKVNEEYFQKIKKSIKDIKNLLFIDYVHFKGTWSYFDKAKVFVNTSKSEGFPQTFIQAVACGVPVVSLNVNPDNFITDYMCGFVCNNDQTQLTKNILKLVSDIGMYNELSFNCKTYSNRYHNLSVNVEHLLSIVS